MATKNKKKSSGTATSRPRTSNKKKPSSTSKKKASKKSTVNTDLDSIVEEQVAEKESAIETNAEAPLIDESVDLGIADDVQQMLQEERTTEEPVIEDQPPEPEPVEVESEQLTTAELVEAPAEAAKPKDIAVVPETVVENTVTVTHEVPAPAPTAVASVEKPVIANQPTAPAKKKLGRKPKNAEGAKAKPVSHGMGPLKKTSDGRDNCRQLFGKEPVVELGRYKDRLGNDWVIHVDADNRVQIKGKVIRHGKTKKIFRTANPSTTFVRWKTNEKGHIIRVDLRKPRGADENATKTEHETVVFDGM